MRARPDAGHPDSLALEVRGAFDFRFREDSLQTFVDHPRGHHRVATAQCRSDQEVSGRTHYLNIVSEQRADPGRTTLPRDNNFRVDAMLAVEPFLLGDPHGAVQCAHRAEAYAH